MESSPPLAVESFSNSWLTSVNSPLDGLEDSLRASLDSCYEVTSEELEYKMLKSKMEEVQNFNFDFATSQYTDSLVHADQLFSEGLIKPIFINQSKTQVSSSLDFVPTVHSSLSRAVVPTVHIHCHIFKRWRKSYERILQKCFRYLRPSCHKITGTRKNIRVDDIDRRERQVKSWSNSPPVSPSITHLANDWCDTESSIYEAVLHCKRSIDK